MDPLLSDYFDHVLQVAKWGQFDSLAHLTYPLRYILAQPGLRVELSKYREKIDAVLLELIQQKKDVYKRQVPPLAIGNMVSMIRWPVIRGTSGGSRLAMGREFRMGHF